MDSLSRIPGRSVSEMALLRQRLKDGHFGFGLVKYVEVVAFSWVNPHEARSALCCFELGTQEAYFYDLYTLPPFRGKELAPYLRCQTYRYLCKMGLSRFYRVVDALNTPAVRYKRKLKARFVYTGVSINLFRRYGFNVTIRQAPGFRRCLQHLEQAV